MALKAAPHTNTNHLFPPVSFRLLRRRLRFVGLLALPIRRGCVVEVAVVAGNVFFFRRPKGDAAYT